MKSQIIFDELTAGLEPSYDTGNGQFTVALVFSSDDPEELTNFITSRLEKVRTNIVSWKEIDGKILVGIGYFYTSIDFGEPVCPFWWSL